MSKIDKPGNAGGQGADDKMAQHLLRALQAGEPLDLDGRSIEAGLLRQVILAQETRRSITPFGLRLRNGEITGRLNLEGVECTFPIALTRIRITAGGPNGSIVARDSRIRRLNISNCTFAGGIISDRARLENGIIIAGGRIGGCLFVRGAEIGGALSVEGTHLGDGKLAILAAGARILGPLVLRRARCHGEVRLQRAVLAAGLRADEIKVLDEGAGIYGDAARVDGDVLLNNAEIAGGLSFKNTTINGAFLAQDLRVTDTVAGLNAQGLELTQSLDLTAAKITGPLTLEGASIGKGFIAERLEIDGGETAIAAGIIRVGGNWEMPRARLMGQIECPGARIGGQLRCTGARIYGGDIAFRADGVRVDGGVFFSRTVISGSVRFPAAEIQNQFRFTGGTIKVSNGIALLASGAALRRDAELNGGFQSIGGVVFDQVRLHGTLDLTASHIKSASIVRATSGPSGPSAGGSRSDEWAPVQPDDIAVSVVDAEIGRLEMPSRASERPRGVVDLSRARAGTFVDWSATWPPSTQRATAEAPDYLVLDGFTYEHLENPGGIASIDGFAAKSRELAGRRRITWLRSQYTSNSAARFKPQAWVYLAQQLNRQGLDRDARIITIERRRQERRSRSSTASARWESRFLDWFALYGFNPWRTVTWMALVIILFAGVWSWAGSHCSAVGCFDENVFVTSKRDAFSDENFTARYPTFHPLAYSFDVFVPFVSFGYEEHWRPNMAYAPLTTWRVPHLPAFIGGETAKDKIFADVTITTGGVLYVLMVLEKILGLILTSLMITGFTGLLRGHD